MDRLARSLFVLDLRALASALTLCLWVASDADSRRWWCLATAPALDARDREACRG